MMNDSIGKLMESWIQCLVVDAMLHLLLDSLLSLHYRIHHNPTINYSQILFRKLINKSASLAPTYYFKILARR